MGSDSYTHTAGPWVYYEGSSSIWSADGTAVCILCGPRDGTRERQNSNAPLIAAAPCMKEALEKIIERSENGELGSSKVRDMAAIARTALSRATKGGEDDH